jgi:tryptophanyl-tRNA synthetase
MAFTQRVFSGVQPTGNLHLGNYLGAIVNFVKLQETHNCIYCVVDMHEVTAAFIASGIDPKKQIIFNQSQVSGHAELAWIFNCVARLGWLNRMTQFKEKAGKDARTRRGSLRLSGADGGRHPALRATHVPVGEDQKQHLELCRDIAQKFNNDFSEQIASKGGTGDDGFFPHARAVMIQGPATRVMSLRDGTKKMSKSDASDNSRINLTDDADTIAQKIRKAKTDPEPLPSEEKGLEAGPRPTISSASMRRCPTGRRLTFSRIRRRAVFRLQIEPRRSRCRKTVAYRRRDGGSMTRLPSRSHSGASDAPQHRDMHEHPAT